MEKKVKIYYGVFACFVLVIMTIGATYAYWTVSAGSGNQAVSTGSSVYSISMQVIPLEEYTGFSFIPMNDVDAMKALKNKCKDKYDRGACSAYQIRVYDYQKDLGYISGYLDFMTANMKNLSFMVLEEKDEFDEDKCLEINEKNFCVSKEATPMGSGEEVSMGDAYSVEGLDEKNLLLVLWLSNLEMNQNMMDIGNFNVTVTIQAGNGGEIKGTIAGAVQLDSGSTTDSSTQDDPDLENNQTP